MTRFLIKSQIVPTLFGLPLLSFALCPSGLRAQQRPSTPTCEVRVDLQYETRPRTVVRTPIGDVDPLVAQIIMTKAGEMHWDELTKHGKKYPGICRDDEHPYYVLVWEARDYGSTAGIYVLDGGCLVFPAVFGTFSPISDKDKATKKVFGGALRFLAEKGKQPAPARLSCYPPEWISLTKYKLTKGKAAIPPQEGKSPAVEPAPDEGTIVVGTGFL